MRIFWVGWGLMQHHDQEAGRVSVVTLCGMVSGGLEGSVLRCVGSRQGTLSCSRWLTEGGSWDLWGTGMESLVGYLSLLGNHG